MTALDRLKQAFPESGGWTIEIWGHAPCSTCRRGGGYHAEAFFRPPGVFKDEASPLHAVGESLASEDAAVDACISAWHDAVRPLVERAVALTWDCEARADISYDQAHKYENTRDLPAAIVRRVLGEDKP